jgi:hypothetical protein
MLGQLPDELQPKLDLPRLCRRLVDRTRAIDHGSIRVKQGRVVDGRLKISPIQDIEELGEQLYVEILRYPLDVVVLKQGEIEIRKSRPDDRVAARIPRDIACKTRGQDGFAAFLSCWALSSPTTCRFIPALSECATILPEGAGRERHLCM